MKVIYINPAAKSVEIRHIKDASEIRTLIGGFLAAATRYDNGDVLYVDDEGLLKGPRHYFWMPGIYDAMLAGPGVLVGREIETDDSWYNADVATDIGYVLRNCQFIEAA